MPALSPDHKRFIVQRLAMFDTPSMVVEAIREEFSLEVDRRQVGNYDAAQPYSRQRMSAELVRTFDETRKQFAEEVADIAISHKTYRLRQLDTIVRDNPSPLIKMQALEQAAKEMGGAFDGATFADPLGGDEKKNIFIQINQQFINGTAQG